MLSLSYYNGYNARYKHRLYKPWADEDWRTGWEDANHELLEEVPWWQYLSQK